MFVLFSFSMLKSFLQHTGEALLCSSTPVLRSSSAFIRKYNKKSFAAFDYNIFNTTAEYAVVLQYTTNMPSEARKKVFNWKFSKFLFGFGMHSHYEMLSFPPKAEVLNFSLFRLSHGCVSPLISSQATAGTSGT